MGSTDRVSMAKCVSNGPLLQFVTPPSLSVGYIVTFLKRSGGGEAVSKAFVGPAAAVLNLINSLKCLCFRQHAFEMERSVGLL